MVEGIGTQCIPKSREVAGPVCTARAGCREAGRTTWWQPCGPARTGCTLARARPSTPPGSAQSSLCPLPIYLLQAGDGLRSDLDKLDQRLMYGQTRALAQTIEARRHPGIRPVSRCVCVGFARHPGGGAEGDRACL